MFFSNVGRVVVEIPKNGTHTFLKAAQRLNPSGRPSLQGHKSISELNMSAAVEYVAVIREPRSRFVSAINYAFGGSTTWNLEDALTQAHMRPSYEPFLTQVSFLDAPVSLKLFPFERIDLALKYVGYDGPIPHENRSRKRWTEEEVLNHPLYETLAKRYDADQALYEDVLNAANKTTVSSGD